MAIHHDTLKHSPALVKFTRCVKCTDSLKTLQGTWEFEF